ncbi:Metallo-dependent phosphatase-like protein [Chaetomium strumarium]|uniref:Metallo-dependent phosphatase-like protein n=1 Tax=Chaetomium strumarium TaxID=1170767 RepID=A0AAJ0GUE5_9PEZI|nr:Metallo-dependent phosphatase-like protein [Chaetomium strumarium]
MLDYVLRVLFAVTALSGGVSGFPAAPGPGPAGQSHITSMGTSGQSRFGPLRFRRDRTFHVSIFEDLHFGENAWESWGPQQDIHSVKVIETILDAEPRTDLVVLNGDLITGENTFIENSTHYVDQIVHPMLQRGLTWASTYGNHDNDFNISASAILARERLWPNARTSQMVSDPNAGVSNYYLPVYAADCHPGRERHGGCRPELLLWFFDSRGGFEFQQRDPATGDRVGKPNWVDTRVVDWFRETNAQLVRAAGGRVIPSLAFVHIPTNASLALQEKGVDPHRQPGIDDDKPLAQQAQGWCPDGVNDGSRCEYGVQDVPFMQAIASTPGLMALFSGHDHGDTWCYKWEGLLPGMTVEGCGVNLCFGQHSGYGGYGSWIRGARQVVVSLKGLEDLAVDTYIRLESGDAVGAVALNRTYGQDWYPATPNDKTRMPTGGS